MGEAPAPLAGSGDAAGGANLDQVSAGRPREPLEEIPGRQPGGDHDRRLVLLDRRHRVEALDPASQAKPADRGQVMPLGRREPCSGILPGARVAGPPAESGSGAAQAAGEKAVAGGDLQHGSPGPRQIPDGLGQRRDQLARRKHVERPLGPALAVPKELLLAQPVQDGVQPSLSGQTAGGAGKQ
jgi:hypothetical protein